ncbi:hypothetical protein SpCBS45565_g07830 [Spizellomyces sp. 'palustris']|nr:hypothetical protein SpCBS45565_g07830 [Spizellomyces sp. 'palustris']
MASRSSAVKHRKNHKGEHWSASKEGSTSGMDSKTQTAGITKEGAANSNADALTEAPITAATFESNNNEIKANDLQAPNETDDLHTNSIDERFGQTGLIRAELLKLSANSTLPIGRPSVSQSTSSLLSATEIAMPQPLRSLQSFSNLPTNAKSTETYMDQISIPNRQEQPNIWDSVMVKPLSSKQSILSSRSGGATAPISANERQMMDRVLFPGYGFAPPPVPSEGFGYSVQGESHEGALCLQNPLTEALDVLSAMTLNERIAYERWVLKRRWTDGGLRLFRGKEEMRTIKEKATIRRKIAKRDRAVLEKEAEYRRLEEEIADVRTIHAKSKLEIPQLEKAITRFAKEAHVWQVDKHLPFTNFQQHAQGAADLRQESACSKGHHSDGEDSAFVLPCDPVLNLFPRYKQLVADYKHHQMVLAEVSSRLPVLEDAMLKVQHAYLTLMVEQDRLRSLDEKVHESDVMDAAEKVVLNKWMQILRDRKFARHRMTEEKRHQQHLEIQAEVQRNDEQQQRKISAARRRLRSRLRETVSDIHQSRRIRTEELQRQKEQRERAMKELTREIMGIRQHIVRGPVPEENTEGGNMESTIESIQRMIQQKYTRAQKEEERLQKQYDERYSNILRRLKGEEARRRKLERDMVGLKQKQRSMEVGWNAPDVRWTVQRKERGLKHLANGPLEVMQRQVISRERLLPSSMDAKKRLLDSVVPSESPAKLKRVPLPPPRHVIKHSTSSVVDEMKHAQLLPGIPPFTASPSAILFEDYDATSPTSYVKRVTITNTSCRTNAIKMLPLDTSLSEFFAVQWGPSGPGGRMSAGKTCEIILTFTPKHCMDDDLDGFLKFLVEYGGEFVVRMGCRKKRFVPLITSVSGDDAGAAKTVNLCVGKDGCSYSEEALDEPSENEASTKGKEGKVVAQKKSSAHVAQEIGPRHVLIHFGTCLVGGTITRRIQVSNKGAISGTFRVDRIQDQDNAIIEDDDTTIPLFQIVTTEDDDDDFFLGSYSSCSIQIRFSPPPGLAARVETSEDAIYAIFFDEELGVEPIRIRCVGTIGVPPVTLDKANVDFGLCIVDQPYRRSLVLKNAGRYAVKILVTGPDESEGIEQEQLEGNFTEDIDRGAKKTASTTSAKDVGRPDSLLMTIPTLGELEISPRLAFLQPLNIPFHLHIKIKPSRSAHRVLGSRQKAGFVIPLGLTYVAEGITYKLRVTLQGRLTTTDVELKIPGNPHGDSHDRALNVDFGTCSIYEPPKMVHLQIINRSLLPQTLRFLSSHPNALSVDGSNGEISLPAELTTVVPIRFVPQLTDLEQGRTYDNMSITCHRLTIEQTKHTVIHCRGSAVCPPLRFDREHGMATIAPIAYGSVGEEKLRIIREWTGEEERRRKNAEIKRRVWNKRLKLETYPREPEGLQYASNEDDEECAIEFEFGVPQIIDLCSIAEAEARSLSDIRLVTPERQRDSTLLLDHSALPISVLPCRGSLQPGESAEFTVKLAPQIPPPDKLQERKAISSSCINGGSAMENGGGKERDVNGISKPEDTNIILQPSLRTNAPGKERDKAGKGIPREKQRGKVPTASSAIPDVRLPDVVQPTIEDNKLPVAPSVQCRSDLEQRLDTVNELRTSFVIPCRFRKVTRQKTHDHPSANRGDLSNDSGHGKVMAPFVGDQEDTSTILLHVNASIVKPDVILVEPLSELDFGQVPVGQRLVKPIILRNLSTRPIKIRELNVDDSSRPPGSACFRLASDTLPEVLPESDIAVEMLFEPREEGVISRSEYTLLTETSQVKVQLAGEGVVPRVHIEEPLEKELFFGDLCVGDTSTKTLRVKNTGSHPVTCLFELSRLELQRPGEEPSYGTVNANGSNAFTAIPTEAVIGPGVEQEVAIKFAPDRESDHFFDYIRVKVWSIPEDEMKCKVHGRCWDSTTALLGYDPPPVSLCEGPFDIPPELFVHRKDAGEERRWSVRSDADSSIASSDKSSEESDEEPLTNIPPTPMPTPFESNDQGNQLAMALESMRPFETEDLRYCTLQCQWQKVDDAWEVDIKDLIIANLKPPAPPPPDPSIAPVSGTAGKKKDKQKHTSAPAVPADFVIDPYEMDFAYYEDLGVFLPIEDIEEDGARAASVGGEKFKFTIEPTEGTVELGHTRTLKIGIERVGSKKRRDRLGSEAMESISQLSLASSPKSPSSGKPPPTGKGGRTKPADIPSSEQTRFSLRAVAPVSVESCFRITLNGGLKFVDPHTVVPATENRVWIVKVVATAPSLDF